MDQPPKDAPSDSNDVAKSESDSNIVDSSKLEVDSLETDPALDDPNQFTTELAKTSATKSSRPRRRMYCFECNRNENHSLTVHRRWFYSFLLGLTFGLISIIGPYQCQCCGAKRLMSANVLNPRFWFRSLRHQGLAKTKKRSR